MVNKANKRQNQKEFAYARYCKLLFMSLLDKPLILILLDVSSKQYEASPFPFLFYLAVYLLCQH